MLDNLFKSEEKVESAPPVAPVIPLPVVKAEPKPVVCSNCDNSGLVCNECGFGK